MSRQRKTQLYIAVAGVLVSLGLVLAIASSLSEGPSPTPGDWSVILLIPFVILNPMAVLFLLVFGPVRSCLRWAGLEWLGIIYWAIAILFSLHWWWRVGAWLAPKFGAQKEPGPVRSPFPKTLNPTGPSSLTIKRRKAVQKHAAVNPETVHSV